MRAVTTDPQDEMFDVLLPDGSPAGYAKPRGLVHRDGDWHRAIHIWVGGVDPGGEQFVVFQRRSLTKDTFPGVLDVAVGGHLRAGESWADAAREADEEIGLPVAFDELIPIGRRRVSARTGSVKDNEVQDVFAARCDLPLDAYRPHPEEVDGILSMRLVNALALFSGVTKSIEALERRRNGLEQKEILTTDAFATFAGGYAVAALNCLQAVLNGGTFEPFDLRIELPEPTSEGSEAISE